MTNLWIRVREDTRNTSLEINTFGSRACWKKRQQGQENYDSKQRERERVERMCACGI